MNKTVHIPWFGPEVGRAEQQLVSDVLKSNYLNDGNVTRDFEKKIGELVGARYCVAVTSGTAAITLALMGLGIGPGDEVIVPDLTFIATANAVTLTGAKVKLVDIEPERLTVDIAQFQKVISSRTKAVVSVDVNGRGSDYERLIPAAKKHGLAVVCDSAEALGSRYKGRYLGTYGDAGCFSFSANKTVTTGQGGMIVTDNQQLYFRLRELKDQGRRFQGTGGDDKHPVIGYNFKLTNIQAAIGLAQLERVPSRLEKARLRDQWYRDCLRGIDGIGFPAIDASGEEVLQWADIITEKKETIVKELNRNSIGCRAFWFPLHTQGPYRQSDRRFRGSITASQKGLWLPSFFTITRKQVEYVSGIIKRALAQKGEVL